MNMHSNKLVVAIKNKGRVLREFKDQVQIPFGSEYSVYIKNLNTVRALVKIEIDGKDIGDGTRFIVEPNKFIDIERFLANGNMDKGNHFKFIERTGSVEEARGIKAEDGLIRVEFQFEKITPKFDCQDWLNEKHIHHYHYRDDYFNSPRIWYGGVYACGGSEALSKASTPTSGTLRAMSAEASADADSTLIGARISDQPAAFYCNTGIGGSMPWNNPTITLTTANSTPTPQLNEAGITVQGSVSEQKFQTGAWFETETETHSIVLHLVGAVEGQHVVKPVTVKSKQKCLTCNRVNKATAKFCTNCGTSLVIV